MAALRRVGIEQVGRRMLLILLVLFGRFGFSFGLRIWLALCFLVPVCLDLLGLVAFCLVAAVAYCCWFVFSVLPDEIVSGIGSLDLCFHFRRRLKP